MLEPLGNALEFASGVEEMEKARREWFMRELEAFFRAELHTLPVRRIVLAGDPAIEIVRYASNERMELIMMPTHGYGPFRRLLMGSVTAKVLHDTSCPVWTGVHLERALIPDHIGFGTIVSAVDLGPQTSATLEWAVGMAGAWSSKLVLVHVVAPGPDATSGKLMSAMARDGLNTHLAALGATAQVHVDMGEPPFAIRDAVESVRADLLVIGRGHVGRRVGRLPSTAYAILRESPCPVVSV